jgi:DNA-binding SARP family transcriptional activator
MFRFHVTLLGSCRVAKAATGEEVMFKTRKTRLLLGLLLLSPGTRMNREQLASLLWDPAPETLARSSLRQALRELREVLGPEGEDLVEADRFSVGLKGSAFDLDVRRFRELITQGAQDRVALISAAELWQGELFGLAQPSAPVFEAWLQIERSQLRSILTVALTDQLEKLIATNSFTDTRIAEELVRIEPSHELAHQYIMRFHAQRGDQSAALRQFGLLEKALAEELDSEPSEASNALLVAIKSGEVSLQRSATLPASTIPALSRNGPPRITIRPPLTRYTDASKDYLGEGFAFLAKSCLSRFRCWIVIPWPSSGFDSATAVDFTAVGQVIDADFAVDCVLDWRTGDGKLFVTLIDCRDGSEVWSELYPVKEHDLQEVSSSVAGALAANLASQVNHITLLRHARSTPGNPVAYDLWLKGHQLSRLWTADADAEAEAMFLKAIELDPGLASSHASLAQILCTRSLVRPGYPNRKADCAEAFRHARDAIALDPYDPRCHISMAWNWLIAKSPERANTHFRMAVDLNPNDAEALIASACGLAFLGHLADGKALAARAVQMNPVYPEYYTDYLSAIQFLDGDYEATIETVEKCYQGFPDRSALAASAWALLGRKAEAGATYQYFATLAASKWEGTGPAADNDLENWIMEVLPIHWPKGQQTLLNGLRLARRMVEQA